VRHGAAQKSSIVARSGTLGIKRQALARNVGHVATLSSPPTLRISLMSTTCFVGKPDKNADNFGQERVNACTQTVACPIAGIGQILGLAPMPPVDILANS
jgi:hypothetical protein